MKTEDWVIALIPAVISIIGFFATYFSLSKSFANELKKQKVAVHIEKMSEIPYDILKLMDDALRNPQADGVKCEMSRIFDTVCAYGSSDAIKIVATMQSENYRFAQTKELDTDRALSFYPLLITQIKYDVTGIINNPELWFKLKIMDYQSGMEGFQKANNKIVNELNLNESFKI